MSLDLGAVDVGGFSGRIEDDMPLDLGAVDVVSLDLGTVDVCGFKYRLGSGGSAGGSPTTCPSISARSTSAGSNTYWYWVCEVQREDC